MVRKGLELGSDKGGMDDKRGGIDDGRGWGVD